MTTKYVYEVVTEVMSSLQDINFLSRDRHAQAFNQKKLNDAYFRLDKLQKEIMVESIKGE